MTPTRRHRAAITGVGLVTGLGANAVETWDSVREGRTAVRLLEIEGLRVLGAPACASPNAPSPEPNITLALQAAREAVSDAGLGNGQLAGERTACTVSSSKGGMRSLFRLHRAFLSNNTVPAELWELVLPSSPGRAVAREFRISGPLVSYAAACATGVHAVIAAVGLINGGEADVVLAGAVDASLVRPLAAAFDRMGVLSHRWDAPERASRPFDRTRDGFAIGEGAAVLVLESEERVRKSPERVYAHVCGSAWGADAYDLARVSTEQSSIGPLLRKALDEAGVLPREVSYLNAHGTGTVANDPMESAAIRQGLESDWPRVPVSSLKPSIGHLLGAAGGAELALTLLAMQDGFAPATLNLNEVDAGCELNHVPTGGTEQDLKVAVKIAAGFGGHIGIVVLERGGRRK